MSIVNYQNVQDNQGDKMQLGPSDRKPETQSKYQAAVDSGDLLGIDQEPALVNYKYWKIILNAFPYDNRWELSMMFVNTKNHSWEELDPNEVLELHDLKVDYFRKAFDKIEENGCSMSSVRNIAHGHLLKGKL